MPLDARQVAVDILNTLDQGQRTLDKIMEEAFAEDAIALKRDRAFMQTLVFGVLRWRGRLDFIIKHFSSTRFEKIDPRVLNILRSALFQIIYLDRVPESAAVNTAVEIAKTTVAPWLSGFVNAVLRKAVRDLKYVAFPRIDKNAIAAIATRKSFPNWIIRRWIERFGLETTTALCDSINNIPAIAVRTNRLKTSQDDLMKSLAGQAEQVEPTIYAPDGITFVNPVTSIPSLNAFKAGWFQVQDEAAQLVSLLLNPQAGERVMDACAGFGGKTGHIAQLMKNKGSILALDILEEKLLKLESEMTRLGITIVKSICRNLQKPNLRQQLKPFDRILLDAPCSGLGVMRRNPDIKWHASQKNLTKFQVKQLALLDNLSSLVKHSGILVYAVCSPEREETEDVVNEFLKNHAEFAIDKEFDGISDKMRTIQTANGWYQTFPHFGHMDGFSFVRLKRTS